MSVPLSQRNGGAQWRLREHGGGNDAGEKRWNVGELSENLSVFLSFSDVRLRTEVFFYVPLPSRPIPISLVEKIIIRHFHSVICFLDIHRIIC
jgi:hypothetical protein